MITIADKYSVVEYRGLSTDTKPTDATNGSSFLEIDSGKKYAYDAENESWIECEVEA